MLSNAAQYEYMDEASIDIDLICVICNKPLEDPRCTPCDHIFCNGCITEWIQRNNVSCPTCRQALQIHQLTQASRIVRNFLGKLRVKCVTCGKIDLDRSDFEHHVTAACPVICLAADIMCPWTGSRGQLDKHVANCNYQTLRPVLIQLMVERKKLKEQVTQQITQVKKYKDEILQLKGQTAQQQIHNQNNSRHAKEREMQQTTQIEQYLKKLRQFEEQLKREQNQNEKQYNEIHQLKHQTKQQTDQVDRYQQEMRYLKEQLKQQSDANQNQIYGLEGKMKQHKAVVKDYHNDTMRLNAQLKKQCVEIDEYQTEIKNLKRQIKDQDQDEIRQLKENEMHYKADIAEYESEIYQLKKQFQRQTSRISELQAEDQRQKDEMERIIQEQNELPMSQTDTEQPGRMCSVFSRLSDSGVTVNSNQTARRHATKRLKKRRFERR